MRPKNFNDHLEKRLDQAEIKTLKNQVQLEHESLQTLQQNIADAIERHMKETGMGFNDVTKGLGISPTQVAKIRKGKANLTVASIAHIAAFLGKKPHLSFK